MKVHKKEKMGNFAEKGVDINEGDMISFVDAGREVPGEYGTQKIFLMQMINGDEKSVAVNQTSINLLIDVYGDDTEKWVGKNVKVWINRENVGGQMRKVLYLTRPGATDLEEELAAKQGVDSESSEGGVDL